MTATAPASTGPYTHENLDVFLIRGSDMADTSNYITLEEALDQEMIVVHETGNAGELLVENLLPNKASSSKAARSPVAGNMLSQGIYD